MIFIVKVCVDDIVFKRHNLFRVLWYSGTGRNSLWGLLKTKTPFRCVCNLYNPACRRPLWPQSVFRRLTLEDVKSVWRQRQEDAENLDSWRRSHWKSSHSVTIGDDRCQIRWPIAWQLSGNTDTVVSWPADVCRLSYRKNRCVYAPSMIWFVETF